MRKNVVLLVLMMCMLIGILPARGEDKFPAVCMTTANLNVREYASTNSYKLETFPTGTKVKVQRITNDGWAVIDYNGGTAYCYAQYLMYWEPIETAPPVKPQRDSSGSSSVLSYVLYLVVICIVLAILRKVLVTILGLISIFFYKLYRLISFPFFCLNWLQRRLARPWMQNYKRNYRSDYKNAELREQLGYWAIPIYILLMPLRFVNALYYNMVVHCSFEMFNYIVEVIVPEGRREGSDNFLLWLVLIPWRIVKYVIWHGALTVIESGVWTAVDTFVPALTVYHGTTCAAAEGICQGPGRVGAKNWLSAVWNVGGGNYAGNGIYFAPVKSTALHYSSGSMIVCRVSFGKTLDLGLAPRWVYDQCGKPNALGVTKWGLDNGYVTGEWWRGDAGWWEYCMYDWQNRYNASWRIRPLYVLNIHDECMQRIPGGMYHWLFNSMVIKDLFI